MTGLPQLFTSKHRASVDLAAVIAENKWHRHAHYGAAMALDSLTLDECQAHCPDADFSALAGDVAYAREVNRLASDLAMKARCLAAQWHQDALNVLPELRRRASEPNAPASAVTHFAELLLKLDAALLKREEAARDGIGVRTRHFTAMPHLIRVWGPSGHKDFAPSAGTVEEVTAAVVRALGSVDPVEVDEVRQAIESGRGEGRYPAWP